MAINYKQIGEEIIDVVGKKILQGSPTARHVCA